MKDWEENIQRQFRNTILCADYLCLCSDQARLSLPDMIKQISQVKAARIPSAVLNDVCHGCYRAIDFHQLARANVSKFSMLTQVAMTANLCHLCQ